MLRSHRKASSYRNVLTAIAFLATVCLLSPALAQKQIIHIGHLIDGVADTPKERMSLVIDDGRITSVENGFKRARAGETVIDLSQKYVMPGFMDMHVHLSGETEKGGYIKRFRLYPTDFALIATKYLKTTLMAGFTTVRDVGSSGGVSIALRNAVKRGDIVGPRMYVAGKSLGVMGGHADATNGFREDILGIPDAEDGVVNGVESARRAALLAIKRGGDLIKITATAGVLSVQGAGGGRLPQFTEDEIRVVVQTAADFGQKVTAHAHGAEGMKRAIRAGVASIEHGTFMDDETIGLFKKHNVYYVPTIIAGKSVADSAKIAGYYQPVVTKKALEIGPVIQGTFAKAYKAGVPIAFGTDAGVYKHGANAKEFQYMVEAGMPPMAAIQSATYHGAKLLGVLDMVGTLESGKIADVVAVDDNPLRDISTLQRVTFVMKEGTVYKHDSGVVRTTSR